MKSRLESGPLFEATHLSRWRGHKAYIDTSHWTTLQRAHTTDKAWVVTFTWTINSTDDEFYTNTKEITSGFQWSGRRDAGMFQVTWLNQTDTTTHPWSSNLVDCARLLFLNTTNSIECNKMSQFSYNCWAHRTWELKILKCLVIACCSQRLALGPHTFTEFFITTFLRQCGHQSMLKILKVTKHTNLMTPINSLLTNWLFFAKKFIQSWINVVESTAQEYTTSKYLKYSVPQDDVLLKKNK